LGAVNSASNTVWSDSYVTDFLAGNYRTQLGKAKSGKLWPYCECTMPPSS